jgi:CRP-like cAMP-binding protein
MSSDAIRAALIRRMRKSDGLSEEDIQEIDALPVAVRKYHAERAIVSDGDRATECCLIAEGFCVRSKTIQDGKRQILSIHIPGEIPDLMSLFLHMMDHDLSTVTPCTLGFIDHEALRKLHRRLAHVLAELRERLKIIGHVAGADFAMPLTQEQIGEALGITSVHANRVIKQLREEGIIDIHRGCVTVLDEAKFQEMADFDDRYLHLSPSL